MNPISELCITNWIYKNMHISIIMHKGKYVYISLKVVILKGSLYTKSLRVIHFGQIDRKGG